MKKLTKILSVLLVCITVFSSASMAVESDPAEEITTAVTKEITTTAQEETTAAVQEEATTEVQEEPTTEPTTKTEEETTAPAEDETTTTPTPDEEITTPEEETTQPEIVLPEAPTGLYVLSSNTSKCTLCWTTNKQVDGYDVFLKVGEEWVLQETTKGPYGYVNDLLCCSRYEIGVKSFILVGEEKYYSEDITTIIYNSPDIVPYTTISSTHSYAGGMIFKWNAEKGISGYILYRRVGDKWEKIATIRDSEITEFDYKFPDMEIGKEYKFAIKTFVKSSNGTKYGDLKYKTYSFSDIGKTYIPYQSPYQEIYNQIP